MARPDIADLRRTWAIVPLRGLADAKTRLGPDLNADARLALVIQMARRTLAATRGVQGIAGTLLVTADPAAAALAAEFGARTLVQRLPGLNAALREARAAAMREGATAILILPIDLPAISPTTIERLLDEASAPAGKLQIVVAVPDRHGSGTNALLVSPPTAIDPAFGEGSLEAHRTAAERAGAAFVQHDGPLTLDVDTGADLLVAQATNSNGGTDAA